MRQLPVIEALYNEIDAFLEEQRTKAREADDFQRDQAILAKQIVNDQAYFLLCWGQIETANDEACRAAIGNWRIHSNWNVRRGWDLYNPDERRLSGLSFEQRATLVLEKKLDKGAREGTAWALTMKHYYNRNEIAHGNMKSARIEISEVVKQFLQIQGHLRSDWICRILVAGAS